MPIDHPFVGAHMMGEEAGLSPVDELNAEANRVHEACLRASESQFANCKIWRTADLIVGVAAAVTAAVAGVAGLAELISAQWAGGIAIAAAALGAVNAALGAGRIAADSTVAGNQYRNFQQDVRVFRNVELPSLSSGARRPRASDAVHRQAAGPERVVPGPVGIGLLAGHGTSIEAGRATRRTPSDYHGSGFRLLHREDRLTDAQTAMSARSAPRRRNIFARLPVDVRLAAQARRSHRLRRQVTMIRPPKDIDVMAEFAESR